MMKKLLAILLALAVLLSVSAVFAEGEAAEATETAEIAAEPTPVPDTLLVTINGVEIRENNETLQKHLSSAISEIAETDDESLKSAKKDAMYNVFLETMLSEKAAANPVDPETIKQSALEEWNEIVEQFTSIVAELTEESTEEEKAAARADALSYIETNYGYTEDKYVEEMIHNLPLNNAYYAILDELKSSHSDLIATDEDVQNEFNDMAKEEQESIGLAAYAQKLTEEDPTKAESLSEEEIVESFNNLSDDEKKVYLNDVNLYEYYNAMYQMYYGTSLHYIPEGYRGIIHILLRPDQELLDNWTELSARLEETDENAETTDGEDAKTTDSENAEAAEEPQEPVTPEMVEAARQAIFSSLQSKIDEINNRIANGESFQDLIAEYGEDPGMLIDDAAMELQLGTSITDLFAKYGKDILGDNAKNGYPVRKDDPNWFAPFSEAANLLGKIGDVSDPVLSTSGIHILYYLRDIPGGPVELTEEEKEELRAQIEDERLYNTFNEYFEEWRNNSNIVWTSDGENWNFYSETEATPTP